VRPAIPSHIEIFDNIYRQDLWRGGSGAGSREDMTRDYRAYLQTFMRHNQVASVVDLGCGDWQFSRHMDWSGIDYVGADTSAVVLETTRSFTRPGVRFLQADATSDTLPAADLLIAKDVLQHWSNADILAFIPQLQSYKWAIITGSFPEHTLGHINVNIRTGAGFRPIDLGKMPFNRPGGFVYAFLAGDPKRVFLWTRA
jgi:SAM-dependent methyltransferase